MKKHSTIIFLILINTCILFYSIYKILDLKEIIAKNTLQSQFEKESIVKSNQKNLNNYIFSEGTKISDIELYDIKGVKTNISKLVKDEMLVFNYSELHCEPCIDSVLLILKNNPSINKEKILILTSYRNERDISLFVRLNHIEFPIYNRRDIELPLYIEHSQLPYFFIINKELRCSNFFIPDKGKLIQTINYLKYISKTIFIE